MAAKTIKVTLKKSTVACTEKIKAHVKGLGLKRPGSFKVLENTPAVRGMIKKVITMVTVEEQK